MVRTQCCSWLEIIIQSRSVLRKSRELNLGLIALYPCNIGHFRFPPVKFFFLFTPCKFLFFIYPLIGQTKTNFIFFQEILVFVWPIRGVNKK